MLKEFLDRYAAERMLHRLFDGMPPRAKTRDEMVVESFLMRQYGASTIADTFDAGIAHFDRTGEWPAGWEEAIR